MEQHLKLFTNHSAYSQAESSLDKPNVAVCLLEGDVHYNPYVDPFNGHAYVDLGLPSGTLWATMNVGANSVTDYGNYYMYGMGSKTYDSNDTPYAGEEDPLATSADTAAQVWGGQWHTPTKTQCEELIANTTRQWVTDYLGSGINGYLFTSTNSNYIFIPCFSNSGYGLRMFQSWTSTPSYMFGGNDGSTPGVASNSRTKRAHVRPVIG